MATAHTLTVRDQWFLKKGLCDPVTKAPFAQGDTVVICADCRVPHDVSTWGLDADKSCACCQRNSLMEFERFSPEILRPKVIRTEGFRMVEEEVPLWEKLRHIRGYPWAYAAAILLPLLTAVLLICSAYAQGIQPRSMLQYMASAARGRLEQVSVFAGWDLPQMADGLVREKIPDLGGRLPEGAGHAVTKLRRMPYRLLAALAGLKSIPSKLSSTVWKLEFWFDRVKLKLEYAFRTVVSRLRPGSS